MAFSPTTAALLVVIGVAVGAFGTIVGSGGGFILSPVLLLLYPLSAVPIMILTAKASSEDRIRELVLRAKGDSVPRGERRPTSRRARSVEDSS